MRLLPLLLALLVMVGCAQAESSSTSLPIGAPAPDFSLPGADGKTYTLGDFAESKVLMLAFTCPHCPTAQAYEDRLQELAMKYKDKGVAVVAINPNDPLALRLDELGYSDVGDSFEDVKIRVADKGFTFPYLHDGDTQEASRKYGPVSTPHVFIFDAERKLRYRGRIDNSEKLEHASEHDARNAIDAILAGEPVPVETTKTSGCSVKWSDKRASVQESLARWAAEPVTLNTVDEEGVKKLIANDSKKLRLINVWATWCGPCVVEFPELVEINRMYRGRDFELVTISADGPGSDEKVLEFLKKQEASNSNYLFDDGDKYKLIEAVDAEWEGAFPYTLLIAPGGEIIYRHMGQFDALELKRAIVGYLGRYF